MLCHTPGVLTETMADTVFALHHGHQPPLVELANLVREGRWTRNIGEDLFGWDVHGKTLGILGFGRIGQAVARRAALGFGMPVLYHGPRAVDVPELRGPRGAHAAGRTAGARATSSRATLPLTDATRGLMDAARVRRDEARRDLRQRRPRRARCRSRRCCRRSTAATCAPPASTCSPPNRCRWIRRCARIRA